MGDNKYHNVSQLVALFRWLDPYYFHLCLVNHLPLFLPLSVVDLSLFFVKCFYLSPVPVLLDILWSPHFGLFPAPVLICLLCFGLPLYYVSLFTFEVS